MHEDDFDGEQIPRLNKDARYKLSQEVADMLVKHKVVHADDLLDFALNSLISTMANIILAQPAEERIQLAVELSHIVYMGYRKGVKELFLMMAGKASPDVTGVMYNPHTKECSDVNINSLGSLSPEEINEAASQQQAEPPSSPEDLAKANKIYSDFLATLAGDKKH